MNRKSKTKDRWRAFKVEKEQTRLDHNGASVSIRLISIFINFSVLQFQSILVSYQFLRLLF